MPPKKNEIYYFILYNKEVIEKKLGKKNMKFTAMFQEPIVYKMFKNLTAEEKQKYTNIKSKESGNIEKKDCRGIPLSLIEKEKLEARTKLESMMKHIHATVDGLKQTAKLQSYPFFILCGSYYVKTIHNKYVPAELSVIRFTLEDGITDYYTNIIKDNLPMGERWEAENYSSETHRLLKKKYPEATSGLQVISDLKNFILHNNITQPVYTAETMMTDCEGILSEMDDLLESPIRVYSLNQLLQEMYLVLDHPPATTNKNHCNTVLNNCSLDYHESLPCQAHIEIYNEGMKYCTLSICRRWFYLLCADLNIEDNFGITPDVEKHFAPAATNTGAVTNIPAERSVSSFTGSVWEHENYSKFTEDFNDRLGLNPNMGSLCDFPTLSLSSKMRNKSSLRDNDEGTLLLCGVGRGATCKIKNKN